MIVGTIAYMSPEQASGRQLDARTDIFSFGVVLYELLAGRRPFRGGSELEVLRSVVHGIPEPLGSETPVALRLAVEKALEKDPAERYQSMRELVVDLRRMLKRGAEETSMRSSVAGERRRLDITLLTVVGLAAAAAGYVAHTLVPQQPSTRTISVQRLTDLVGLEETPSLSPDKRTVAFVAVSDGRRQIFVRLLAGGSPLPITTGDVDHISPRWSPDSATIIY